MPTILDQINSELKKELNFYHKGVENITRPGQTHRVGDNLGFTVYAKNVSGGITLKNISGWISPQPSVTFSSVSFNIGSLTPNQEKSLGGKIIAKAVADTNDIWFLDIIAVISASAEADLSAIRFNDSGILVDSIQKG